MFDRFSRVVSSNVNKLVKNMEDPEKILDQAVEDMQRDLVKIRQSYAEISATQKRMESQKKQADDNATEWYRRAQLALEKGDEELAREALSRRQTQVEIADGLGTQITTQNASIDKLFVSMQALEVKITDAKRNKDAMIARARTAKTTTQVNDMLNTMTGQSSNSMEAFDRMKAKVEAMEAEAEVAGELAATSSGTSVSLEEKFKALEGNSVVDDELENLRKQLPGSVKEQEMAGELPAKASEPPMSDLDIEYEKIKKELGKS
jgi:phage shock protein A